MRRVAPGAAQVLGEGAGEAELGVGGDDEPGPQIGAVGVTDFRGRPAEGLLPQPEGVLQVESAEEGLPPAVHVHGCGGIGRAAPQPDRFRVAVAGQALDLEANQRTVQDGQFLFGVVQPGGLDG